MGRSLLGPLMKEWGMVREREGEKGGFNNCIFE